MSGSSDSGDASRPEVDELVARFLAAREADPGVTPEAFLAEHAAGDISRDDLSAALECALDALRRFPETAARPAAIGPYRIVREIGRGGMGVVYEARREGGGGGPAVALKILPFGALSGGRALERFRRESAALAKLDHPGLIAVREAGTHDGAPWIAMDLIEGQPLDAVAGRVAPREAARIVRDLAQAVAAAHGAGVLHRDLKPANVRLRADGSPVLLDFGLVADETEATLTGTGDLLGTPTYMAPEQARCAPTDARTDVHGLGLILFELLAGRPARAESSRAEMLERVQHGRPPSTRDVGRDVPAPLAVILARATAWKPARRYATAGALAGDLDAFLDSAPIAARPFGPTTRLLERIERRPTAFAFGGLAFAIVLLVGLMLGLPALDRRAAARHAALEGKVDRAAFLWLRDRAAAAAQEVEGVLASEPRHAEALALRRLLDGGDASGAGDAPAATLVETIAAARAAEAEGRLDDAERLLDGATRRFPESLALAEARSALFWKLRRHAEAVTETTLALERAPDDAELWHRLAKSRRGAGAVEEALEAARRAAALSDDPTIRTTEAVLLDQLGRRDEARAVFAALVERFPDRPHYPFNIGYSLDTDGRVAEALPYYERSLALDPTFLDAAICVAWLRVTAADLELRDAGEAERLLLEALDRDEGRSARLLRAVVDTGRRLPDRTKLAKRLESLAAADGIEPPRLGALEAARRELVK